MRLVLVAAVLACVSAVPKANIDNSESVHSLKMIKGFRGAGCNQMRKAKNAEKYKSSPSSLFRTKCATCWAACDDDPNGKRWSSAPLERKTPSHTRVADAGSNLILQPPRQEVLPRSVHGNKDVPRVERRRDSKVSDSVRTTGVANPPPCRVRREHRARDPCHR